MVHVGTTVLQGVSAEVSEQATLKGQCQGMNVCALPQTHMVKP